MDQFSDEQYLISRAKNAPDPNVAKAMILTAKTIFPKSFRIQVTKSCSWLGSSSKLIRILFLSFQFEAYQFEKASGNHDEAAKSFSYL